MRRRYLRGLLGLLLLPLAGSWHLLFVLLRFLSWRPQLLCILAGGAVVLSTGNPVVDQFPVEEIGLLEHMIFSWGCLVVGVLVLGYGLRSRLVWRLWHRGW